MAVGGLGRGGWWPRRRAETVGLGRARAVADRRGACLRGRASAGRACPPCAALAGRGRGGHPHAQAPAHKAATAPAPPTRRMEAMPAPPPRSLVRPAPRRPAPTARPPKADRLRPPRGHLAAAPKAAHRHPRLRPPRGHLAAAPPPPAAVCRLAATSPPRPRPPTAIPASAVGRSARLARPVSLRRGRSRPLPPQSIAGVIWALPAGGAVAGGSRALGFPLLCGVVSSGLARLGWRGRRGSAGLGGRKKGGGVGVLHFCFGLGSGGRGVPLGCPFMAYCRLRRCFTRNTVVSS